MCVVHNCTREVYRPKAKFSKTQRVCFKHWINIKSGRVGANWARDIHNFHRKGVCARRGRRCGVIGEDILRAMGIDPATQTRAAKVRLGMQTLQGDHINGRNIDQAHFSENIQTLCAHCHLIKSIASGDNRPVKYR